MPLYGDALREDDTERWERLRKRFGGLAPVKVEPEVAAWLILGYEEHRQVLRDPHLFTHDGRIARELLEGRLRPDHGTFPLVDYRPNALHNDGAEHQRLRTALVDSFERLTATRVRAAIEDLANDLIDAFAADGRADLIGQYATWIPLLTLNRMFGQEDRHGYFLCESMVKLWNGDGASAGEADRAMVEYLSRLVSDKRREPGPDIASWLIAHPAELSDAEVTQQIVLLIAAAHDPTTHLIGNTLRLLLTNPDLRFSLAGSLMQIEEALDVTLWRDPPFKTLIGRYATRDTTVAGYPVRRGDMLISGFAAGNNDPILRDADGNPPHVQRPVSRAHLSWGLGPHSCPARGIAYQMAASSIAAVSSRLPDVQLAVDPGELRRRSSPSINGLVELPVTFTPQPPLARPHRALAVPPAPPSPARAPSAPEPVPGVWARVSGAVRAWFGG
ncbi:cytochrome P450 [Marinitenerispora sediminis]|uniref:Cytochrome P450 n=1 Tax=Marinitenerispora sediminis TaxID=1931232 RepID=A0A368T3K0_9ACTN|nr:cytochrome P450 [Marinitenerispora sediminis]RCV55834.1 cytochrome P450 [Marinitenerispora sediminis]RCV56908.1 cytochrome P450 [Marinitenerispora sediminis]